MKLTINYTGVCGNKTILITSHVAVDDFLTLSDGQIRRINKTFGLKGKDCFNDRQKFVVPESRVITLFGGGYLPVGI